MVCRGVAHSECAKNLDTLHQKSKDHSPNVTRFFKVMFGKDFQKVLYLPPLFARSVKHLAGRETQIEDASGFRWPVTFSYVDGSLAFHKGWSKFFIDHGLGEGYFLVFNYINGSHFSVQIYGESACETTNFDNTGLRRSKRLKTNLDSVSLDEPFQTMDISSREKPSSVNPVALVPDIQKCQTCPLEVSDDVRRPCRLISTNMEDPSLMIGKRDDGCYRDEGRDILYDLSCFEVEKTKPDVNALGKVPNCLTGIIERNNAKGDESSTQMDVIHADVINEHSNDGDKLEEALGLNVDPSCTSNAGEFCIEKIDKVPPSHTVKMGQMKKAASNTNEINGYSGELFMDKFDKASDKKLSPFDAVKKDQIKMKGDDSQMAATRSEKVNCSFGDIADKFHNKRVDNCSLSKKVQGGVLDCHNGDSHLQASDRESPISRSKTAEREYAVKEPCLESSISSQGVVKNEQVELNNEDEGFSGVSYERRSTITGHSQMFSPVVKVEPDLPDDTDQLGSLIPFSAEVESQFYLELPLHIPSAPGRRDRGKGKVVYLRDPAGRLWPVLYLDLFTVKVLTGNWSRFCEQNRIKPGDECRFQVENEKMCYYRVDVTYRQR